jgi:hypothetical protein
MDMVRWHLFVREPGQGQTRFHGNCLFLQDLTRFRPGSDQVPGTEWDVVPRPIRGGNQVRNRVLRDLDPYGSA